MTQKSKNCFFFVDKTEIAPLNPELDGQFNGCSIRFQFVNPYYHELTARTCANLLYPNLNPSTPIEYQIGCDCVFPFAMNYKGDCIQEDECTEREAFGDTVNNNRNAKNKTVPFNATSTVDEQSEHQQLQNNSKNAQNISSNLTKSKY